MKRFCAVVFGGAAILLISLFVAEVHCQENAIKKLPSSLLECYDEEHTKKWNLLPHNMQTFISIIRKIEEYPSLNMDLRMLSVALLHRFRQDGIIKSVNVKPQKGVMPYVPQGKQFYRHAETLRVIQGNAINFPNNSISAIERCSLHSMLSSSIGIFERGDESRVCKMANYAFRRFSRSADGKDIKEDVETLTPEQIEMISKGDGGVDPNSMYPALPPNHPSSARFMNLPPVSRCPMENGVIKTPWGTVSGGPLLAGITASLQPQLIRVGDLIKQQVEQRVLSYPTEANVNNKFFGTLAGDLAEVVHLQSPQNTDHYILGAEGNWNSSTQPLYYFLKTNENLQMTGAEIRGDLDGLVLADIVPRYYEKIGTLSLSQVLDMYYSKRGFFDPSYRACNRRTHYLKVAPTETLISQTHSAALVLSAGIARATISSEALEQFATQAVKNLSTFIPRMNEDKSCEFLGNTEDNSETAVNLTIVVDTTWSFDVIKSILAQLLENLDVCKFNSYFKLINGLDGSVMINSSYSILDFHSFNSTQYANYAKGFDLARVLEKLNAYQMKKLNEEQRLGWGGGKSDVILFAHYQGSISPSDKDYCIELLKRMREEVPDTVILFLTYGRKDQWSELVLNPSTDVVSISIGETSNSYPAVDTLQSRIKQVPRRLINSQCGAYYKAVGSSHSITESVGPYGVNFYRIHPNYFSSDDTDNPPRIKIQGIGIVSLNICWSRELMHVNANSAIAGAKCVNITHSNTHTIDMNCEGTSYLHECKPYYLSIAFKSNNTEVYECTDSNVCRYPNNVRYTISYENLVCKSGANALFITPLFILIVIAQLV